MSRARMEKRALARRIARLYRAGYVPTRVEFDFREGGVLSMSAAFGSPPQPDSVPAVLAPGYSNLDELLSDMFGNTKPPNPERSGGS